MVRSTDYKSECNPDIGSWVTSSVTTMYYMFRSASSFDKNISSWNTSAVVYMGGMFYGEWPNSWGSLACPPSPPASPPASPPSLPSGPG